MRGRDAAIDGPVLSPDLKQNQGSRNLNMHLEFNHIGIKSLKGRRGGKCVMAGYNDDSPLPEA